MSFLPASRTARRLAKLASLGLAGLLAGLLSGCTSSDLFADALNTPPPAPPSVTRSFVPTNTPEATLPDSLDSTLTPPSHTASPHHGE